MDNLQIFNNEEFGQIRTVTKDGEPQFAGRDVATILGYSNPRDAISKHVDDEDKGVAKCDTLGGKQQILFINESGLYSLILSSKLPTAKKFKRWVTSEILPSIRKHGMYATEELIANPDLAIAAFTALKEEREKNKMLEQKIEHDRPKTIFADAVSTSHTSILIGDLAKIIRQNGVDIGQKRLFEWMRQNGYLIKSGSSKNMPTQKSMDMKLFEVKESTIQNPDGSSRITRTTKVTGKGQLFFVNKMLGS